MWQVAGTTGGFLLEEWNTVNFAALPNAARDAKATPLIRSGATSWAGRQKKAGDRVVGRGCETAVAMGMAIRGSAKEC